MILKTKAHKDHPRRLYLPVPPGFLTGAGVGGVTFEALPSLIIGLACGLFFEDMKNV
jgi:hypothetical protein